jgi:DNA-binding GntR family transcriptional regulator
MVVTASQKHRGRAVHREHCAIIEAIEQRDPDAAERLMRAHLVASRENLMKWLRRQDRVSRPQRMSVLGG